jgi:hypothetical protein
MIIPMSSQDNIIHYIIFGTSLCAKTFCVYISARPHHGKLLPKDKFPHEITHVIATRRKREFERDISRYISVRNGIMTDIPMNKFEQLHQIAVIYSCIDENPAPSHTVIDLTSLSAGINWVLLTKKSRPEVISWHVE